MNSARLIFGICFLLSGIFSPGQNFWAEHFKPPVDANSFVSAIGNLNYGCDGVRNDFLHALWRGGYLDSAYIEKSSSSLLPVNRFGVSSTIGITYGMTINDSTGEMLTISVMRRNNISARFKDDAFQLAFKGNMRFKGEEADFGYTHFSNLAWSQLKIGYITPQKDGGVAFSFSILAGHRYNEADISYGRFFTDSQGMFVSGGVTADFWASDTSRTETMAMNGWGTSVDVTWVKQWEKNGNPREVMLDFIDFGFINWNSKTIHQFSDTTFTYSGVDIAEIFLDPDYVAEAPGEEQFIKSDTSEFHRSIFLPAVIRGMYGHDFLDARFGIKLIAAMPFWSEALPYASLQAEWRSVKYKYIASGGIAYGGYAGMQVPLKLALFLVKRTAFELGTSNALGFISPAAVSGAGAYVKLSYGLR